MYLGTVHWLPYLATQISEALMSYILDYNIGL